MPDLIVWRISEFADLDGLGGLKTPGRWHHQGRAIVYTAEHAALAILETLVHLEVANVPPAFQLLKIRIPDGLATTEWPGGLLPDERRSAAWGDAWLRDAATPIARVPTAIAPAAANILINPAHPASADIAIVDKSRHPWDRRLFR